MKTFRKTDTRRAIASEVAGLAWLTEADGAPVAELVDHGETFLETRMLDHGSPTRESAAEFGRRLAQTHAAGADWWGQAPPGLDPADLVHANLPMPAPAEPLWGSFGEYWAEGRLRPHLEQTDVLASDDLATLHRVCDVIATGRFDSPQPAMCGEVARIHGDLWGQNVVWADGGRTGTLIDPAANGGHAEQDLADLAIFGSPQLEAIIAGYNEVSPLADGWEERVELHQLHMLFIHIVLFGGSYIGQTVRIARRLLR